MYQRFVEHATTAPGRSDSMKLKVPWRGDARRQLAQRERQLLDAGHAGMRLGQLLHDPAEGVLAVGAAHRVEAAVQPRTEVLQVAVVGEHPVAAPQLAHEGVAVLQVHRALRGLADVGDDVAALDRVAADQLGHRRLAGRLVVDEVPQARGPRRRRCPSRRHGGRCARRAARSP